jgi:hypothetical protein
MAKTLWVRSVHDKGHWRADIHWPKGWTVVRGDRNAKGVTLGDDGVRVLGPDVIAILQKDKSLVISITEPNEPRPAIGKALALALDDDDEDVPIQERIDRGVKFVPPSQAPEVKVAQEEGARRKPGPKSAGDEKPKGAV